MSGVYGADVSTALSVTDWTNLKNDRSSQFAIVRCYRSNGQLDENAPQTVKNARAAGLQWVDVYHFPDRRVDAATQVNAAVDALQQAGAQFDHYWFDIEADDADGCGTGWSQTTSENVTFLQALVDAANARGLSVGIYTASGYWSSIMGSTTAFSKYFLWYIHWDNQGSFSDFKAFGGWVEPSMKQKAGGETWEGVAYDGNWCPAALPTTTATQPSTPPSASTPPPSTSAAPPATQPPATKMTGTQFIASLPPTAGTDRENAILAAVRGGNMAPVTWSTVACSVGGHSISLLVSSDALRIGTAADAVRVSVTPCTMQQIADMLGCVLPTSRICDLIWEQATVQIPPHIMTADSHMADTSRMAEYDAAVTQLVDGRRGLIENIGKAWCLTNKLVGQIDKAANYGWYDSSAPYRSGPTEQGPYHLWQMLATAHNLEHVDYSQVMRLVSRVCTVDGRVCDLRDVLTDPTLAALASDEGPLQMVRLAGVDEVARIERYSLVTLCA